jgi:acyl-CoA thioesterase FadM
MAGPFDFQLVKQATQWKAAARYDQVLEIGIRAEHLGNTSFTLTAEFRVAGDERVIVTAETVYVLVEAHSLRKTHCPRTAGGPFQRCAGRGYRSRRIPCHSGGYRRKVIQ